MSVPFARTYVTIRQNHYRSCAAHRPKDFVGKSQGFKPAEHRAG